MDWFRGLNRVANHSSFFQESFTVLKTCVYMQHELASESQILFFSLPIYSDAETLVVFEFEMKWVDLADVCGSIISDCYWFRWKR
jgi:hypothetical protein